MIISPFSPFYYYHSYIFTPSFLISSLLLLWVISFLTLSLITMSINKGEVMWPRLVASKILKKRLGSNNFVADIPNNSDESDEFLVETTIPQSLSSNHILANQDETQSYKVFVSTWNVGGVAPTDDLSVDDLLGTNHSWCDIYVFGFQEIVPLRPKKVLGSENGKISSKWNSIIRGVLNKKAPILHEGSNSNSSFSNEKMDWKNSNNQQEFGCIISKQMVGIMISVWIRNDLRLFVRNPSVSCVGCGIMGCLGNKGAVSVRFQLHETRFCFVCSHLASGGREGDEKIRNSNVAEILSRTTFPRGLSLELPRKIQDHDRVIFLGDLNYRISLQENATRLLIDKGDFNTLLEYDQLRSEMLDGQVFKDWHEGIIKFAPTYKYYPNSDGYYGGGNGKKGEKKRAPAWCDRIIWFGEGLKQHKYGRGESKMSDHRPVRAIFSAEVKVSRRLKKLRNFFLSERFEQITHRLELHSSESDEFRYSSARLSLHIS